MQHDQNWITLMRQNQQVLRADDFYTLDTTTTPAQGQPLTGTHVSVTVIGDDHKVNFGGAQSAIIAQGTTATFDVSNISETVVLTIQAVNSKGTATVYQSV